LMETLHPPGHLFGKIGGQRASLGGPNEILKGIFGDLLHRDSAPFSSTRRYVPPCPHLATLRNRRVDEGLHGLGEGLGVMFLGCEEYFTVRGLIYPSALPFLSQRKTVEHLITLY